MLKNTKLRSLLFFSLALLLSGSMWACAEPAPPKFEVISLNVTPPEVFLGETVSITAEVKNTDGMSGSYSAVLTVNGLEREIRIVPIAAGDTKVLTFTLVEEKIPGTYEITVGSMSSRFLVKDYLSPATETEEIELDLVETAPPSHRLDVTPVYFGHDACMVGSITMLLKYDDPSLDVCDIVAASSLGSTGRYVRRSLSKDPKSSKLIDFDFLYRREVGLIFAPRNLNYDIILGIGKGGRTDTGSSPARVGEEAKRIEYFDDVDGAFDFLKRAIASGYPVEVHLKIDSLLRGDFAKASNHWVEQNAFFASIGATEAGSHFMVVTGYDEGWVFLNDPTDPGKPTDLATTVDNFKLAWNVPEEVWPNNTGPYWMLIVKKNEGTKSVDDILAWNKNLSADTPYQTSLFAENAPQEFSKPKHIQEVHTFSEMRLEYARFLAKNGKGEAAALYEESGKLWVGLLESSNISEDLRKIADLEEQARSLY
ncbi:MAG: CARDB domain-containing protein [Dehalococcoidales bacterium]|nr:CARDB domain-containing protein [Dehalococcoidales bacterium]